jgi:hypothetical protein
MCFHFEERGSRHSAGFLKRELRYPILHTGRVLAVELPARRNLFLFLKSTYNIKKEQHIVAIILLLRPPNDYANK